jgi:hypothetical protein
MDHASQRARPAPAQDHVLARHHERQVTATGGFSVRASLPGPQQRGRPCPRRFPGGIATRLRPRKDETRFPSGPDYRHLRSRKQAGFLPRSVAANSGQQIGSDAAGTCVLCPAGRRDTAAELRQCPRLPLGIVALAAAVSAESTACTPAKTTSRSASSGTKRESHVTRPILLEKSIPGGNTEIATNLRTEKERQPCQDH